MVMKFSNLLSRIIVAASALITAHADIQSPTYNPDDLILGFRSLSGSQCYVVNIGQASQFTNATSAFAITGLGDIVTDLATVFGNDWSGIRPDMLWSVSGASSSDQTIGNDPPKTLYATRLRTTAGIQSAPWLRASDSAQSATTDFIKALGAAYTTYSATANSPGKGVIQTNTDVNCYASYQPGGTIANSGPAPGTSFQAFNPTIEGTFANRADSSVLDLFRMTPGTAPDQPGSYVGTFVIAANGTVTFTPIASTPGTLAFTSSTFSQVESSTLNVQKTITVSRTGGSLGAASVEVTVTAGSAISPDDYTATTPVTLNWANGDIATKSMTITVKTDGTTEGDETVFLELKNATGAALGNTSSATLTVSDPPVPGTVAFSSATFSQTEPSSGTAVMTITVNRTGGSDGEVSVDTTVTADTATVSDDYTATTRVTLTWADGDSAAKTFNITVKSDLLTESAETINLALQNATGGVAIGTQNIAVATINDLPPAGVLAFSSATYAQSESSGSDATMTITVNRTGGAAGAAGVQIAVSPISATTPEDFSVNSPVTLNWADGDSASKSFDITIHGDADAETDETFSLSLTNPTIATLGTQTTAVCTINDGTIIIPLAELGGSYNGLISGAAAHRGI